jgi:hypothetical protein
LGDSKLVVDWALKKTKVENVCLEALLQDVSEACLSFEWLSFNHIYRELNSKFDELSKEAL